MKKCEAEKSIFSLLPLNKVTGVIFKLYLHITAGNLPVSNIYYIYIYTVYISLRRLEVMRVRIQGAKIAENLS